MEMCPGRAWSTSDDMLWYLVVCLLLQPSSPALDLSIQAGVSSFLGRLVLVCYVQHTNHKPLSRLPLDYFGKKVAFPAHVHA